MKRKLYLAYLYACHIHSDVSTSYAPCIYRCISCLQSDKVLRKDSAYGYDVLSKLFPKLIYFMYLRHWLVKDKFRLIYCLTLFHYCHCLMNSFLVCFGSGKKQLEAISIRHDRMIIETYARKQTIPSKCSVAATITSLSSSQRPHNFSCKLVRL